MMAFHLPPVLRRALFSLVPLGWCAALSAQTLLVKPYVQPGHQYAAGAGDGRVILWLTDEQPGQFEVDFGATPRLGRVTRPVVTPLNLGREGRYLKYAAYLSRLPLDGQLHYRVRLGETVIRAGTVFNRKSAAHAVEFVVVGDTGDGKADERRIAHQIGCAAPEFAVIVGDIVYPRGTVKDYLKNFFGPYNNTVETGPLTGAPVMATVPFYGVLGNHDVAAANLATVPDGLGAFYFFHPPRTGPAPLRSHLRVRGTETQLAEFKSAAADALPHLGFYSFENGPVHGLCLDANRHVDFTEPALLEWIRADLTRSRAPWKLVFCHHPAFQATLTHYREQQMRLLAPLLEACGVDIVFAGHVHNYQRSVPLRFKPSSARPDRAGLVNGAFTLDTQFDGVTRTVPQGVIHVVTGGGGAGLYKPRVEEVSPSFQPGPENWVPFTAKYVADRHSFSIVQAEPGRLLLRQMDEEGVEVDRVILTKPAQAEPPRIHLPGGASSSN
jgi:predicted phosphodiesterase